MLYYEGLKRSEISSSPGKIFMVSWMCLSESTCAGMNQNGTDYPNTWQSATSCLPATVPKAVTIIDHLLF